ncbi:MAG: universal stress protein [Kiloniellales bacterium]
MIKTIVVPTDGSEHANKAVLLASDIAEKYGARLVLLHVLLRGGLSGEMKHMAEVEHLAEREGAAGAPFAANIPAAAARLLHDARADEAPRRVYEKIGRLILDNAETTARKAGVEQIKSALEDGEAAQQILDCAEREGANLIVMGSRGLGAVKGLLMGSVSHKVTQLAPCTCVTVK